MKKSNIGLKIALAIVGVILGYWVITKLLAWVVGTLIFKIVLPVVVIGAIGYVGYRFVTKNSALPGRRRSPLP